MEIKQNDALWIIVALWCWFLFLLYWFFCKQSRSMRSPKALHEGALWRDSWQPHTAGEGASFGRTWAGAAGIVTEATFPAMTSYWSDWACPAFINKVNFMEPKYLTDLRQFLDLNILRPESLDKISPNKPTFVVFFIPSNSDLGTLLMLPNPFHLLEDWGPCEWLQEICSEVSATVILSGFWLGKCQKPAVCQNTTPTIQQKVTNSLCLFFIILLATTGFYHCFNISAQDQVVFLWDFPTWNFSAQDFTKGSTKTLVATDVAARGLDVEDITLVVCHWDGIPRYWLCKVAHRQKPKKTLDHPHVQKSYIVLSCVFFWGIRLIRVVHAYPDVNICTVHCLMLSYIDVPLPAWWWINQLDLLNLHCSVECCGVSRFCTQMLVCTECISMCMQQVKCILCTMLVYIHIIVLYICTCKDSKCSQSSFWSSTTIAFINIYMCVYLYIYIYIFIGII